MSNLKKYQAYITLHAFAYAAGLHQEALILSLAAHRIARKLPKGAPRTIELMLSKRLRKTPVKEGNEGTVLNLVPFAEAYIGEDDVLTLVKNMLVEKVDSEVLEKSEEGADRYIEGLFKISLNGVKEG